MNKCRVQILSERSVAIPSSKTEHRAVFFILAFSLFSTNAFANVAATKILPAKAPHTVPSKNKTSTPAKPGEFVKSGAIIGGTSAGAVLSILRIQKLTLADATERLILTYGDKDGIPLKTAPGYFHLQMDAANSRLILDLSEVQKTAVDGSELAEIFASSRWVRTTDMTMDPQDHSSNITLQLRAPIEARALIEPGDGKRNQLVIDLRPIAQERTL
jgi:hypothetical protein